ncbi:hypothetical protein NC653_040028 [Populus alba x Populus x berolinensis]|uniref:Uncharacterized protein n=1 Tax=Populus alba x Populus x berolinensis TaxID=444605 RepID=A0AAD6PRB5_9ROSI|nr:hypothetical protein NC653_040028 [Populus alba x Populus x berolinensis]
MKEKKMKKVKNGEVGANGEEFSGQGVEVSQLSGKKHGIVDVKGVDKVVGKVKGNGKVENVKGVSHGGSVKRFKATDMVPTNATKEFCNSLHGGLNKLAEQLEGLVSVTKKHYSTPPTVAVEDRTPRDQTVAEPKGDPRLARPCGQEKEACLVALHG